MLNQSPKLSKKERKRMYEEYKEIQREKSRFELEDNDYSVSSWDFVYYTLKYKSKD
jgi:Zn-dependent oligopeptidase